MATLQSSTMPLRCLKYKRKFYEADDYLPWSPDNPTEVQEADTKRHDQGGTPQGVPPPATVIRENHHQSSVRDSIEPMRYATNFVSLASDKCQSGPDATIFPPKKRLHVDPEMESVVTKATSTYISSASESFLHDLETPQSTQEICMALINMQFWRPEIHQKEPKDNVAENVSVNNVSPSLTQLVTSRPDPESGRLQSPTCNVVETQHSPVRDDPRQELQAESDRPSFFPGDTEDRSVRSAQTVIVTRQCYAPSQPNSVTIAQSSCVSSSTSEYQPEPLRAPSITTYTVSTSKGRHVSDCDRNYCQVTSTDNNGGRSSSYSCPVQDNLSLEGAGHLQIGDPHYPALPDLSPPAGTAISPSRVDPPEQRPGSIEIFVQPSFENVRVELENQSLSDVQSVSQINHVVDQDGHLRSPDVQKTLDLPSPIQNFHSPVQLVHSLPHRVLDSPTECGGLTPPPQGHNPHSHDMYGPNYPPPAQSHPVHEPQSVGRVLSLFPKPTRARLLWEIVEMMSRRHQEDYFTDWSAERIMTLAPDERPNVFPVTANTKKELVSKSVFTENKKLAFAWYSQEEWGHTFRDKLKTGIHKTLSEAKKDASQLWKEHCPGYDGTRAVRVRDNGGNIVMKRTRAKSRSEFEYRQNLRKAKANTAVHQIWSRRAIIADVLQSEHDTDLFSEIEAEHDGYKKPANRIQQLADIIAFTLKRELLSTNTDK